MVQNLFNVAKSYIFHSMDLRKKEYEGLCIKKRMAGMFDMKIRIIQYPILGLIFPSNLLFAVRFKILSEIVQTFFFDYRNADLTLSHN